MKRCAYTFKCLFASMLLLFSWAAKAQEDQDHSFDEFMAQSNLEFEAFKERENREFAEFLRKEWEAFQTFITPTPMKKPRSIPRKEPTPNVPPTPPIKVDPIKVNPIPDKPQEGNRDQKPPVDPPTTPATSSYPKISLEYFRTKVSLSYDPQIQFSLSGADERSIADAWVRAGKTDFAKTVVALGQLRSSLSLSDWGFYLLVYRFSAKLHSNKRNESLFLTNFLLNQSGYSSQLGRSEGSLLLLLNIEDIVYARPYLTVGGRKFVIFAGDDQVPSGPMYTYSQALKGADAPIQMSFTKVPDLTSCPVQVELPNPWKGNRVRLEINKSLIDYYTSFPQMQAINYLFPHPSSTLLQLQSMLRPVIAGKSQHESVSLILDFVQKAFNYQTDNEQFGCERWFFPEETLFYPFSDCEDRSFLFAHLVQSMLGLKVALLHYPNHMATAVCLDQEAPGVYFNVNNRRYTLCDPTYIGAGIGDCMPDFRGVSPEIMPFN